MDLQPIRARIRRRLGRAKRHLAEGTGVQPPNGYLAFTVPALARALNHMHLEVVRRAVDGMRRDGEVVASGFRVMRGTSGRPPEIFYFVRHSEQAPAAPVRVTG